MSVPRLSSVVRFTPVLIGFSLAFWGFAPLPSAEAKVTVTIALTDQGISPASFRAKQGEVVAIEVVNHGSQVHNLVIPAFYIFTQNLQPGENVHASFRPDKTGRFPYYSDTGGKPEPGIQGTMSVTS